MSKRQSEIKDNIENRDRIHVVMFFLSLLFMVLGIVIVVWIIKIQATYSVDERVIGLFRPTEQKHVETPVRGRILATDGRPMAISAPLYDVYMDCTVRKQEYEENGKSDAEQQWRAKARELSTYLSNEFRDKSADAYAKAILEGRDKGSKYLRIQRNIDLSTLQKVKTFPLFKEGPYTGGIIVQEHEERIYPYDSLARRVIGYVKEQNRIGLESSFDTELHGRDGYEWRRVTDNKRWIRDLDSTVVKVEDGKDIRTTLNVDFQDIADKALRAQINANEDIRAGICIIMEAKTGAIRAMVNLSRGATPQTTLWERENLCLREVGEQGSVMKTVTLLSVVEDGFVKSLEQTIPTNNGFVPNYKQDVHILDYQRETGRRDISVMHGFEISSNYVFTYLAEKCYGENPQELFDHIYSYRLGEAFDFDINGHIGHHRLRLWHERHSPACRHFLQRHRQQRAHDEALSRRKHRKGREGSPPVRSVGPQRKHLLQSDCRHSDKGSPKRREQRYCNPPQEREAVRLRQNRNGAGGSLSRRAQRQLRPLPRHNGPQEEPGYIRRLLPFRRSQIHHPGDSIFLPLRKELLRRHDAGPRSERDCGQDLRPGRRLGS